VARRETDHPAESGLFLGDEQLRVFDAESFAILGGRSEEKSLSKTNVPV